MRKPELIAMTPREYEANGAKKVYWTEIGVAWRTKSGEGINVKLNAFPVNGEFSLFPPKERPKSEPEV